MPTTLREAAVQVLNTADPAAKVSLTGLFARNWREGRLPMGDGPPPPDDPARPERPQILLGSQMPNRGVGSPKSPSGGKIALLHALAHIELNAIDLAWDAVARFGPDMPEAFSDDWVDVAWDEARHFTMLETRLGDFDSHYGALPAHGGLWDAARKTAHDPLARMACLPMVFEARGLDTTPPTVAKISRQGDRETARILETIGAEEIPHVAAGVRWFEYLCAQRDLPTREQWRGLVRETLGLLVKGPFNHEARISAGMTPDYYEPLAALRDSAGR